jgi:hypothetical protein
MKRLDKGHKVSQNKFSTEHFVTPRSPVKCILLGVGKMMLDKGKKPTKRELFETIEERYSHIRKWKRKQLDDALANLKWRKMMNFNPWGELENIRIPDREYLKEITDYLKEEKK